MKCMKETPCHPEQDYSHWVTFHQGTPPPPGRELGVSEKYSCNRQDCWLESPHAHTSLKSPNLNESGEVRVTSETGGQKGQKDVRIHALPWESLAELGRVFSFGEKKYDDYNFRKGYQWSLSFDALQRHVWAFWNKEDRDEESGLHHMAHAAWHALVLTFYSLTGVGEDDRPTN